MITNDVIDFYKNNELKMFGKALNNASNPNKIYLESMLKNCTKLDKLLKVIVVLGVNISSELADIILKSNKKEIKVISTTILFHSNI